jgi:archaemetzincin
MQITLRPFVSDSHPLDARLLDNLAHDLATLGLTCRIATPLAIPEEAYNARRGQYRAELFLARLYPDTDEYLLGIAACDLYTGDYNFVFGLAQPADRIAIISIARLVCRGDAASHRQRILKEAVHELGHTFGLGHCPNPNCVMHFSNTLADTDRKGSAFCAACRRRLPTAVIPVTGSAT